MIIYYSLVILLLLLLLSRFSRVRLCDPIDGSAPGSTVPGILQARTLEWVAISFSNAWKWKVKVKSLSCVWPSATPWTAAYQAPPSLGFSRREYWSGAPLPSPTSHSANPQNKSKSLLNLSFGGKWAEVCGAPGHCMSLSHSQLFAAPWTVACQAGLSMGFSRQEFWSGCHFLLQGIFLTQRWNLCLLHLLRWQMDSLPLEPPGKALQDINL